MGFSISWIGFKALSKAEVLGRVGFCEADSGAGLYQSPGKSRFSVSELPTGWTIVYSKDVAYGSAAHLAGLSTGSMVVACQVEEHAMFSAAHSYQDTRELWSVWHDSQRGARDLSTRGVLPPEFAAIRDRLGAKQDEGSGLWASGKVDPKNPLVAVLKRAGTRVRRPRRPVDARRLHIRHPGRVGRGADRLPPRSVDVRLGGAAVDEPRPHLTRRRRSPGGSPVQRWRPGGAQAQPLSSIW